MRGISAFRAILKRQAEMRPENYVHLFQASPAAAAAATDAAATAAAVAADAAAVAADAVATVVVGFAAAATFSLSSFCFSSSTLPREASLQSFIGSRV